MRVVGRTSGGMVLVEMAAGVMESMRALGEILAGFAKAPLESGVARDDGAALVDVPIVPLVPLAAVPETHKRGPYRKKGRNPARNKSSREKVCAVCRKKFTDNSPTNCAKSCSSKCKEEYKTKRAAKYREAAKRPAAKVVEPPRVQLPPETMQREDRKELLKRLDPGPR